MSTEYSILVNTVINLLGWHTLVMHSFHCVCSVIRRPEQQTAVTDVFLCFTFKLQGYKLLSQVLVSNAPEPTTN